jgi:peptidoglycan hydrolase-like protein with peptidoglycan-binding domain
MMLYGTTRSYGVPGGLIDSAEPLRATVGNTGIMVGTIQGLLNFFGARREHPNEAQPLVIDNVFGRDTYAAVRAFQTANHLTVDGVVGPETSSALQNSDSIPIGGSTVSPVDGGSTTSKVGLAVLAAGAAGIAYTQRDKIARLFRKKG